MAHILVIDDDKSCCRTLELHFGTLGYEVSTANRVDAAIHCLSSKSIDLVISDIRMPGRDGLSFLEEAAEAHPQIPVIMMTAFQDLESTVAALQKGAADYVGKPIDLDQLDLAVERALGNRAERDGEDLVLDSRRADATLVGRSRAMQEVFKAIGRVSQNRATVLITGESGTGKELIARAIHKASANAKSPFVAINCSALVETLLESELFGHERGAFTGAVTARKGKAETAADGVLFLDEVAELSPRMQGKLLRLLEARDFMPVGSSVVKTCKARFIAATNADLKQCVEEGTFREDLFYRLNVVNIYARPLRERPEDNSALCVHLLKRINEELGTSVRRITVGALNRLSAYDWPGNVRQLNNVLTQAVVMAKSDVLTADDLPGDFLEVSSVSAPPPADTDDQRAAAQSGKPVSLKKLERRHILHVLDQTGWHKGKACEILGISRPRLDRRLKEYGVRGKRQA